jgi:hypothetical protein
MEEVIYAFIEIVWPRLLNDLQIWLNYTLMRTYERRNHEPKPSNSGDNRNRDERKVTPNCLTWLNSDWSFNYSS